MASNVIHDPETGSYFIAGVTDEIEFGDPIQYYRKNMTEFFFLQYRLMLQLQNPPFPPDKIDSYAHSEATKSWNGIFKKYIRSKVPVNIYSLLKSISKKEQEKLLRGQSITPEQFYSFTIRAWVEYGFTFSSYYSEHLHNGADESGLPTFIKADKDEVAKIGNTKLSDGQLRQVIEQRKVVVSKFYDKGDEWHCFFTTYNSLSGKEKGEKSAHFHYISDKFGITREEVLKQLKSRQYKLGSLPHIDYIQK